MLNKFGVPATAWRVHATAWDILRQADRPKAAEAQRLRAQEVILALAHSFAPDETLRYTFLAAPSIIRILAG